MAEVKTISEINDSKYPSNSRTNPQPQQREKVAPVVKSETSIKKPSFGEKVKKALLPGDIKDVRDYAINQVLIPGMKNAIIAIVELALFQRVSGRNYNSPASQNNRTNYTYISSGQVNRPSNLSVVMMLRTSLARFLIFLTGPAL